MKAIDTELPGCKIIEPAVFDDARGFFYEAWNAARFAQLGLPAQCVQHNLSRSQHGVLRGLHYQWPNHPQGKLVSVLEGEVFDVAVDIRRGSPGFGQAVATRLSADNKRQLWIPEGCAHGFLVLSESALVSYLCTAPYTPASDCGLRWDDPQLGIDWPLRAVVLSDRDAAAPRLADLPEGRLPVWHP
ncbi:dTDP-4-dehydrorhamnose 3,5-epimerase [Thermomonas sp.]|uniref:dTDP-4-dehydrorhamnose 3,5-epimerase n=1 Tax=Thermomonas sp. TaxID=1971895 RepID=UPI00261760DF|nr:dTDP-4-dehydrorhamnose 3,5-epimerase [Thermomonas sp.]MCO5054616.1 dTDP-4-dehydrorhamnose 3,5-epimerase [Thermomonas sp.]HRO64361.1 dTDP-4-dehydrorhamnose 3,5-epimerase [Thermomonas sp.]